MEVSRQKTSRSLALAWLLIILATLIILASVGFWIYSATAVRTVPQTMRVARATARPATPTPNMEEAARTTAQRYMSAFVAHDYNTMWSMLSPQIQATWPNETSFAAFYKAKFQDYTLGSVSLGQVQAMSYWINPETMARYDNVEKVSVSLHITPTHTSGQLPPEDLQPASFVSEPAIAAHSGPSSLRGRLILKRPSCLQSRRWIALSRCRS